MVSRLSLLTAAFLATILALAAQPTALTVNTASREETRQFFRAVYGVSDDIPVAWTGNLSGTPGTNASGSAGTISSVFQSAVRLRVNWYRAMAGVPAGITFSDTFNRMSQQAAAMMSANNSLTHTPPGSWFLFTADGFDGAFSSNLALGRFGPDSITFSYMCDAQGNNFDVGHRRWILFPQTRTMGTGDIPPNGSFAAANALYIFDGNDRAPRPNTREPYVAWPAPGFAPYQVVFARWSFSHPNADFSTAAVTMSRGGTSVPVRLEVVSPGAGEPTIVWAVDNLDTNVIASFPRPAADTTYNVTVSGVRIAGAAQSFSYAVTVFDPDVPSTGAAPTSIGAPATTTINTANAFAVTAPSFVSGFEWRTLQLASFSTVYNAEGGLAGVAATTSGTYNALVTAPLGAGTGSYHLATPTREIQTLRLPETYHVPAGATASLTFLSRLSFATSGQVARVQITLEEGGSWTDLYTQAGVSDDVANRGESSYATRTVNLSAFAGRTFNLRFAYTPPVNNGAPAYANTDASNSLAVGWFLDNITLTGVQRVAADAPIAGTGANFSFMPAAVGLHRLQARGVLFGAYPLEWSSVTAITAATADGATTTSRLSNLSVRTTMVAGQTLIVGAVTTGPKQILVRGVGPTLRDFGVTTAMPDPRLELYKGDGAFLEGNSGWADSPTLAATFTAVGAFPLTPGGKDSALVRTLDGGSSVQLKTDRGGIALVELYDTGSTLSPRLTNASTRNLVGTGDNILIVGFYISGTGTKRLLIRAAGPTLASFGVTGTLADPRLDVFLAGNNTPIAFNDNWTADLKPVFASVAAFPLIDGSKDSALVVELTADRLYNIQVKGADAGSGEAIVEIYELP